MKKNEAISILATSVRPREQKDRARYDEAVKMAIDALNEPERKTGRWIRETKHYKDSEQEFYYCEKRCSECGTKRKMGWAGIRYCPMCGARLVQEGEDNEQVN